MLAASLCFAGMSVCVKLAAAQHSAAEIVFWRSAISLVIMFALMRLHGTGFATPALGLQVFRGLTGFVSLTLYFVAIVLLPLATAVTLNYTSPLFLAIFLAVFGGVRLRASMLVALGLGLLGVAVVLKPTFSSDQLAGGLAAIASGFLAGLAYFNVRELGGRGEPEVRTVYYFALMSTLCATVWVLVTGFRPLGAYDGLLLIGVGVFATIAQLAMTRAYKVGKTVVSASLAYTTVIFASVFGVMIWGDVLGWLSWLGIGLIIVSGIAATLLSRERGKHERGEGVPGPTLLQD